MVDLLAHALIGLALGRLLAVRYEWMTRADVTAVVVGTFVPDLVKIHLLVEDDQVEALLGIPFDWMALQTGGGAAVAVVIGLAVVAPRVRRRTAATLAVGTVSHLFLDALLLTPTGVSYPVFWPLSRYHPPTPGIYLSTQWWPTVVAALLAGVVVIATDPYDRADRSKSS